MAPLVEAFHPSNLPYRLQTLSNGQTCKPPVDLKDCALKQLVQYSCDLTGPANNPRSRVVCEPVLRLFRQCATGLTVETTSWEDIYDEKGRMKSGSRTSRDSQGIM